MNPCAKNKRRIAWMAAGVLDESEGAALRKHLETCPGCRGYGQSLSDLSERLVEASDLPPAELSASFHGRLTRKVCKQEMAASPFNWATAIHGLWVGRRLAIISAAIVLGAAALIWIQHFGGNKPSRPVPLATVRQAAPPMAPPPTLASYRRAAEISLESLDALLMKEAARNARVVENFTVASLLALSSEK